jgi:hypothetical protein
METAIDDSALRPVYSSKRIRILATLRHASISVRLLLSSYSSSKA